MTRAFVFVAVLLAIPLPATGAQRGSPVQGGGSFTEAPLVDERNYSDTIRLTEELFYAVELSEGQGMKVTAQLLGERNGPQDPALLGQLQVYSTLRDRWPPNELEGFDAVSNSPRWSIVTPEVGGDGDGSTSDAEFFAQPGTYYFSLRLYRSVGLDRDSPVRRREIKTRLMVKITGVALDPSPTPTEEGQPDPHRGGAEPRGDRERRSGFGRGAKRSRLERHPLCPRVPDDLLDRAVARLWHRGRPGFRGPLGFDAPGLKGKAKPASTGEVGTWPAFSRPALVFSHSWTQKGASGDTSGS